MILRKQIGDIFQSHKQDCCMHLGPKTIIFLQGQKMTCMIVSCFIAGQSDLLPWLPIWSWFSYRWVRGTISRKLSSLNTVHANTKFTYSSTLQFFSIAQNQIFIQFKQWFLIDAIVEVRKINNWNSKLLCCYAPVRVLCVSQVVWQNEFHLRKKLWNRPKKYFHSELIVYFCTHVQGALASRFLQGGFIHDNSNKI